MTPAAFVPLALLVRRFFLQYHAWANVFYVEHQESVSGHSGVQVPKTGLKTPFKSGTVQDVALQVLALSKEGLQARGSGEEKFLSQLHQIAESGETGSSKMRHLYETKWGQSVDPVYSQMAF